MRICEKCKEQIDESSVFCGFCGAAQPALEQSLSGTGLDSVENLYGTKTIWSNKVVRLVAIASLLLILVGYWVYKFPLLQENMTAYITNQSDKSKKITKAHSQIVSSLISFGDLKPGVLGTYGNPMVAEVVGELLLDEGSQYSKISGNIIYYLLIGDLKKCVNNLHANNVKDLESLLTFTNSGYIKVKVLLSSVDDLSRHAMEGYECGIVLGEYNKKSAKTEYSSPAPVAAPVVTSPVAAPSSSPVDQIKSEMMDKYYAFHETKSYAEWDEKDMEKAVDLLAHPVTDADIKSFQDDEKSTLNLECSTGSCLIHQREFTAAKMIREGKAKTAQEALGFDSKPADVSVHQQQTTTPSQVIESLLNAARADNIPRDIGEQAILSNLPKPGRGNRKVAREKNTAGLIALNTSNYKVAIALFAEGATFDQSDIEITNNLGYALMMDDQLEAAKAKLVDVLSLDISRSGAWANLGDVFAKIGSQEKAVAAFKLSYYFSRAPEKTIEFFKKHSEAETDEKIRNASSKAIAAFSNIQPMILHP